MVPHEILTALPKVQNGEIEVMAFISAVNHPRFREYVDLVESGESKTNAQRIVDKRWGIYRGLFYKE